MADTLSLSLLVSEDTGICGEERRKRDFKVTIRSDDTGDSIVYKFKNSTKAPLKRWEFEGVDEEVRGERTSIG